MLHGLVDEPAPLPWLGHPVDGLDGGFRKYNVDASAHENEIDALRPHGIHNECVHSSRVHPEKWYDIMHSNLFLSLLFAGLAFAAEPVRYPDIPREYLVEAQTIPDFWVSTVEGVNDFLDHKVSKGEVSAVWNHRRRAADAGGCVWEPAAGTGHHHLFRVARIWRRARVPGAGLRQEGLHGHGSVHGGELEGIVGITNLIAVLETGRDLRGKEWPEITEAAASWTASS